MSEISKPEDHVLVHGNFEFQVPNNKLPEVLAYLGAIAGEQSFTISVGTTIAQIQPNGEVEYQVNPQRYVEQIIDDQGVARETFTQRTIQLFNDEVGEQHFPHAKRFGGRVIAILQRYFALNSQLGFIFYDTDKVAHLDAKQITDIVSHVNQNYVDNMGEQSMRYLRLLADTVEPKSAQE